MRICWTVSTPKLAAAPTTSMMFGAGVQAAKSSIFYYRSLDHLPILRRLAGKLEAMPSIQVHFCLSLRLAPCTNKTHNLTNVQHVPKNTCHRGKIVFNGHCPLSLRPCRKKTRVDTLYRYQPKHSRMTAITRGLVRHNYRPV